MKEEFVSYTQAVALKELGFDEPCMAIYYSKDKSFSWHHHKDHTNDEPALDSGEFNISAPTYSAAFRWFREEHGLNSYIYQRSNITYRGVIHKNMKIAVNYTSDSSNYEEAEQACLDKLIEIVRDEDTTR